MNAHPAETCSTISGSAQDSRMDLRFFYIFLDSLRVVRRFRFRSTLILLSAMLGIGGVIVSVNFAAGGRQLIIHNPVSLPPSRWRPAR